MAKPKVKGNGEGTIYYNGKYWVAQITIGRDYQTGKLKRKSFYGKTKKEVKERLVNARFELNNNIYTNESSILVSEWALYWLENFKKNEIQDSTYEKYKRLINKRIVRPFNNIKLKDLTAFHIQSYINALCQENLRESYIKTILKKLNSMLSKAVELKMIKSNPCKYISPPKLNNLKTINILTLEEQKIFTKYCYKNYIYGKVFIFLLGTGCRIGEALALKWEDIDFKEEYIKINKTITEINGKMVFHNQTKTISGNRIIPMSIDIKNMLLDMYSKNISEKNKSNLVFTTEKNGIILPSNLRWHMGNFCKKAGIKKVNIHALRHTFATRALEQGMNIKILSEILGHKDIKITLNTYTHISQDTKKEEFNKINIFN